MRIIAVLIVLSISFLTVGCSSHVVPQDGPTMEQTYDSMPKQSKDEIALMEISKPVASHPIDYASVRDNRVSHTQMTREHHGFRKVPNPELAMYIYPHLSGKDEVPIPGYYTAFNAYTQDHYAMSNEG